MLRVLVLVLVLVVWVVRIRVKKVLGGRLVRGGGW